MLEDRWVKNFEKRFTVTYMVALGVLAGFGIFAQMFGFFQFAQRDTAAHVVNIAARQRTLSEQIAKMALLSRECTTEESWKNWAGQFGEALNEWGRIQAGLRIRASAMGLGGENTDEIQAHLDLLAPLVERVRKTGRAMTEAANGGQAARAAARMDQLVAQIQSANSLYLRDMDYTVGLYEREATTRGMKLQAVQVMFPTMMLILLFVLGAFVFRPAGKKMNLTVEALRDSERRFHAFMDNSPMMAYMKDESGKYVYVNQSFQRLFRLPQSELVGKTDAELLPEEISRKLRESDLGVLTDNRSAEVLEIIPGEKGDPRHWLAVKFPFLSQSGKKFLGGTSIDITERVLGEEALRASEKRWQLALRGTNDGLWDWNAVTNEVYYSARWKQMLGFSEIEISNTREEWEMRVHPDDLPRVKADMESHLNRKTPYYVSEYRMRRRDGNYLWVLARGQAVWDEQNRPLRMAGSHTDITDRKTAEEQLTNEAASDPLTQLSNRRRLLEQVSVAFHSARATGNALCVCLCDVDKFKQVNDDCGHAVGDRVLSTFAQILREALRSGDIAGRLGGDEFCVILPGARANEAEITMERVRTRLETMLFAQRDGKPFHVSATFGVAELNSAHQTAAELMDGADQALYEGKRNGRNRVNIRRRDEKPKATRFSS